MEIKRKITGRFNYKPLAALIVFCLPGMVQAEAKINNMTASVVNGVTVIDINKANDHGISHNIYDQLNVGKSGLIFNNSQNAIKTTLAGEIKGNSNLTSGAAKVILNEVTSKNRSALQGWMEIAGSKAHLIIANPNGISCQGCGFINAEKVTVTTGKPDMDNGMLKGYSVNGGVVTLTQLENASPTEILARSVKVNGAVYAQELSMVTGNNYVDINGNATGTVKAQGSRQVYGIDVAAIGGMYADKISLISSENGVGVRNSGVIAGTADIRIDSNGRLINNYGRIKSAGLISIKTKQGLDNLVGKINSDDSLYIDTNKSLINNNRSGDIAAKKDVYIDSGVLNNINGKISAGGTLGLNTHNKTLTNTGKGDAVGIHAAVVALQTGRLDNRNGLIKGHYVGASAGSIDNTDGTIESTGDTELSSNANVENRQGLIRSTAGHVHIDAVRGSVNNGSTRTADTFSKDSQGIIAGEGGIQINAASLNNRTGQISSKGDISFTVAEAVDNYQGKLTGAKSLYIKAKSLMNGQAGVSSRENIHIELKDDFSNNIGIINSDQGDIMLQARSVKNKGGMFIGQNINIDAKSSVDNSAALMVANKNLVITAGDRVDNRYAQDFGDDYGSYLAMPNQEGGMIGRESVTINAGRVDNDSSRIVAEFGKVAINSTGDINNTYGQIVAQSGLSQLTAQAIYNDYAMINSNGSMTINTGSLSNSSTGNIRDNNATGIVSAGEDLIVNVGGTFTNYGWISSQGNAAVKVEGTFYNRNTINADRDLTITAKGRVYNYRDIFAGNDLALKSDADMHNSRLGNIKGTATINFDVKGEVVNDGNLVSNKKLTINSGSNIYNYSNMFTYGLAEIKGEKLSNTGSASLLGGFAGLNLNAGVVSNSGVIVGL